MVNIFRNVFVIIIFRRNFAFENMVACDFSFFFFFFSSWVFFYEHSRLTGQQGKGEAIFLTSLYHFNPCNRHLGTSRAITADGPPLHMASSQNRESLVCKRKLVTTKLRNLFLP